MVYAGSVGTQTVHLGVSGRLLGVEESKKGGVDVRNLVMWDPQTGSLWGQLRGEALQGPAKGKRLDMLPAVFVGLGTWAKMHPKTKVLNLSAMPGKDWHFTTTDLAEGKANDMELAVALRRGDDTLAVVMSRLQQDGIINESVDGQAIALIWHREEKAVFAYAHPKPDEEGKQVEETMVLEDGQLRMGAQRWNALTGAPTDPKVRTLDRVPYIPTYVAAWVTYYPKGRVIIP